MPSWTMRRTKNYSGRRTALFLGLLYGLGITAAFLWPVSDGPALDIPYLDKGVHVAAHAILSVFWLLYVYTGDKNHFSSKAVALVLVTCFSYGIAVEAMQHWFTETRTFDLLDIAANGTGELVGLVAFGLVRERL